MDGLTPVSRDEVQPGDRADYWDGTQPLRTVTRVDHAERKVWLADDVGNEFGPYDRDMYVYSR